jgi:two-component system nitrate/nitrite response regulator NarL
MELPSKSASAEAPQVRPQPQSDQAREAPSVFILSDVRLYREGVALSLARRGELAVRGSAAPSEVDLDALVRSGASVLLLDASMGGGLELMKRLKFEAPQVKVVAVSVNDSDDDRLAHIEAGAAGCVAREGSIEEVVQTVLACVRGEAACSGTLAARLFDRLSTLSAIARPGAASPWLTRRELELLRLVNDGLSNKEIARALRIGLPTVKNHIHQILAKLGVRRRGEAAAWLRAHGALKMRSPAADLLPPRPRAAELTLP